MPYFIGKLKIGYRVDDKIITTDFIVNSPASGTHLEESIKTALKIQEVEDRKWDLYVHVYSKRLASLAILMCRHGLKTEDNWWNTQPGGE